MKGKFEHCHQFTDKGKENYDQIKWNNQKIRKEKTTPKKNTEEKGEPK